jgi:hypothetical protein
MLCLREKDRGDVLRNLFLIFLMVVPQETGIVKRKDLLRLSYLEVDANAYMYREDRELVNLGLL